MPVLPFPEYRPDTSDFNGRSTTTLLNVLPRSDGYGPMNEVSPYTQALPAECRGAFMARRDDGSVNLYGATATRLYKLDNTSLEWVDVSKDGSAYSTLATSANWSFAQFGSKLIAVQANVVPQVIDVEVGSAFDALGGSPPQAAHVTIINRFVVLSGLLSNPRRIQWSGLNAITTWTSGTTYSDYQDMPDGGNVQCVVGGEFGVIVQDGAIRRMIFSPGSEIVFQIDRIARDIGTNIASTVTEANGVVYMYTAKGFISITSDGAITPIGFERVDRTFATSAYFASPHLIQATADPASNLIFWTYREESYALSTSFNRALVYNASLDRWAPIELEGEFITQLGKPGVTLEGLNTIGQVTISGAADNGSGKVRLTVSSTSGWTTGDIKDIVDVTGTTEANGTHAITVVDSTHIDLTSVAYANAYVSGGYVAGSIDAMDVSLDEFSAATLSLLAMVNTDHRLGYFTGSSKEAILTAAEQSGMAKRIFIRGLFPITDAASVYGSVGARESMTVAATYSSETAINAQGFCPQRVSTRHARGKLRIPAGTTWTFATGIEPDFTYEGRR